MKTKAWSKFQPPEEGRVLVDDPEEEQVHGVEDGVHAHTEEEVEAELHGPTEREAQEVSIQSGVAHQMPIPV